MTFRTPVDLFSLEAHGQVGKKWIYWHSHGFAHRRPYKIPFNPKSPRQQCWRATCRQGTKFWNNLTHEEKNIYSNRAKNYSPYVTGFYYFMHLWFKGEIVNISVKSIQRGNATLSNGSNNITISEVNIEKSIVICPSFFLVHPSGLTYSKGIEGYNLTSSTNLRIDAIKGENSSVLYGTWQVIELF